MDIISWPSSSNDSAIEFKVADAQVVTSRRVPFYLDDSEELEPIHSHLPVNLSVDTPC